jgi:PAS domain S-box-containing protein
MNEDKVVLDELTGLRSRVATLESPSEPAVDLDELSHLDLRHLVHDLRVRQVELEMQNEELRQTQRKLQASRDKYFDLYDLAPVGYLTVNQEGLILEANLTAAALLGVETSCLVAQPLSHFVAQDNRDTFNMCYQRACETRTRQTCDLKISRGDGSQFYARLESMAVQRDVGSGNEDHPSQSLGDLVCRVVLSDVSEWMRAENALRETNARLDALIEAIPDVIYFKDAQGQNLAVNKAYEELLGLEKKDILGKTDEQLLPPILSEQCWKSDQEAIKERHLVRIEEQLASDQGERIFFDTIKVPLLDEQGNFEGLVGISRDVTERVQVEEALRESEEKYRRLVQNSIDGIAVVQGAEIKFVNQRLLEMFGCQGEDEMVGHPFTDFVVTEYRSLMAERGAARERGERVPSRYRFKALRRDGDEFDAELSVSSITYQGSAARQGIVRDVTEQVRAESQRDAALGTLRESEERYRTTIDAMDDPIHVVDHDLCLVLFNEACHKAFVESGIKHDPSGMGILEFCPFLSEEAHAEYERVLETGKPLVTEEATKVRGRTVWTETRKIPILDEAGETYRVVTIVRDITDQVQASDMLGTYASQKAALLQLSANLAALLDEADVCQEVVRELHDTLGYEHLGLYLVDESTGERVLYANIGWPDPAPLQRISPGHGLSERPLLDGQLHHTPDVTRDPRYIPGLDEGGAEVDVPLRVGDKVLGVLVIESSAPDAFDEGDFAVLTAVANQASVAIERARQHQAVKQAQARYRSLFDGVPVGLYRSTPEGQILDANQALVQMSGYSDRESLLAVNVLDTYIDPKSRKQMLAQAERKGGMRNLVQQMRRQDGTAAWVEINFHVARDADGQVLHYEGSLEDITEQVQAEQALRESEEKYRLLVENASEAISAIDQRGRFIILNNAAAQALGGQPQDFVGKTLWDVLPKEAADERWATAEKVIRSGQGHVSEICVPVHGGMRWFRSSTQPIADGAGEITSFLNLSTDITERKQAEAALQRRNRELTLLNQASRAFSSSLNLDQVLATVLRETCHLLNAVSGSVWLVDQETNELVCQQDASPHSEIVRGWRLSPGQGVAGWTVETGESIIVPDTRTDAHYFSELDEQTGLELRSLLGVPLRVKDKVIGVLHVTDTTVDRFELADLALVEPLAATAAIAIENAQLYEQARQDAETRAILLHEVNHRVKNNLTSILGVLSLEMGRDVQNVADFQTVMHDLQARIRGLATVHDMLSATRWAPLPLDDLVEQVIHAALGGSPLRHKIRVTVTSPGEPLLVVPKQATALAVITNELTTNSIKYAFRGRDQGRIDVQITDGGEDRQVTLKFRNDGPGWPEDVLQGRRKSVGLHLVRLTVRSPLRGQVMFHNDAGAATTITFTPAPLDTPS